MNVRCAYEILAIVTPEITQVLRQVRAVPADEQQQLLLGMF
jgi:hypothetical protein